MAWARNCSNLGSEWPSTGTLAAVRTSEIRRARAMGPRICDPWDSCVPAEREVPRPAAAGECLLWSVDAANAPIGERVPRVAWTSHLGRVVPVRVVQSRVIAKEHTSPLGGIYGGGIMSLIVVLVGGGAGAHFSHLTCALLVVPLLSRSERDNCPRSCGTFRGHRQNSSIPHCKSANHRR